MHGKWLKKRVGLILILFFCFSIFVFGQDKQDEQVKQLREETLSIYKSKGVQGLRKFAKKQGDKISNKFIVDFAIAGKNERKEEWLKICEIMAKEKKDEKTLADVLFKTGEYFSVISDFIKAADYFNKAHSIYLKLNDLVGKGNVYWRTGDIYFYTGDNSRAFELYDKALTLFKKTRDTFGLGNVYRSIGNTYMYIGNYSKALEFHDKALFLFEKMGVPYGQGTVYSSKGYIYFRIGKNSRALEMYEKALTFYEITGEPIGQGNVYFGQGEIYLRIGDNSRALKMYDKALPYFEKVEELLGQGNVYCGKGNVYSIIGDNDKALEMYDKALPFFEKTGEPIGQGSVYRQKGEIYSYTGENLKALEMYAKALPFYEKAGDNIGQGNVYLSQGGVHLRIGELSKSLKMYDKALLFFEKVGEPIGQGSVYWSKGKIYFYTGNNSKALEMYDKALPFYEKSGQIVGKGNVCYSKGEVYFQTGDISKALEMYSIALPFFEKVGAPIGLGNVYKNIGDIYLYTGDNSKALEMYENALTLLDKAGDIASKSVTLHGKAKVLVKLGNMENALTLFEKGIVNLERVRAQTAFSEMKRTFMEVVHDQYEETVLFMLENKYYDKSFRYAESMRTRVFLDRMAEELVRLDKGLAPDLKEKWDNLVAKLSRLNREIHKTAGEKNEKRLSELKEQYRKVENEFEELLVDIRLNNPLYASVRYPQPVSVQDLQKGVLKRGELLLRYFVSSDKIYVFLISKENFKTISLKGTPQKIKRIAEQYLTSIKENNFKRIKKYGKQLYKKLFQPLETSIKGKRNLIIVPDGELVKIPFETLVMDSKISKYPVFLLEKYRIKYAQSASILSILRKHYQRDGTTNHFIGFGDPVYDYENFKQGKPEHGTPNPIKGDEITEIHRGKYTREGGQLVRLKASGEEVNTIAQLFKEHNQKSVVHVREQANEANAKASNLNEFDYIHFSCHGILGDGFQSLVLSQLPQDQSTEDGYFTLNEIMNCDYNAKLVVLSACQTGSGKMYRGEGVMGLTRAVMYAGTPAVVASLWDVDDRATKELMVRFYRNMLEKNMDKVEAVRQAKLELIKTQTFSSPYFWSAFIMYGE